MSILLNERIINDMDDGNKYGKIEFGEFKFYSDGTGFECTVKADDHSHSDVIFFRFNKSIGNISNNLVFAALMTLVGKDWYENAIFDLSVSKHVYEKALLDTKSRIQVKDLDYPEQEDARSGYDGSVLNLSGGIDSNALYYLLKRGGVEFHSVTTDFGPDYSRDVDVTEGRVELVMSTNIRKKETMYVADRKTWTFMGIAAILSADHFRTKNILFGQVNQYDRYLRTILKDESRVLQVSNNSFFSIVDCRTYGIQFLTEFQNAIVLLDNVHDDAFIRKISDASATLGHVFKFYRKQIFLIAAKKYLKRKNIDFSRFKFLNAKDKFHRKFIEHANAMTEKDKNMVLLLGLKYLGYIPKGIKNNLLDQINDFSFIENVYQKDIPQFYLNFPGVKEYLSSIFTMCE